MAVETLEQHEALVLAMMDARAWPQGGADRRRIDTHISTVVLAGDQAYKLKKPLDLGFLDFLTLDSRHAACEAEVRLNRRLAPDIYLGVVAVTGSIAAPRIGGAGRPIDWAVHMRRFDPDAILAHRPDALSAALIDALAERVADFHAAAPVCPANDDYGTPALACAPMQANFDLLRAGGQGDARLVRLDQWTRSECERLAALLATRKADGHVRECHGDLHLGNVALIDDAPVVFDAIEFNPALRWIDTVNDVAFMTMDLHHGGRDALAYRFLDHYLQAGGDYPGLSLLRLYEVYRALVRAKIAAIRLEQVSDADERDMLRAERDGYVALADRLSTPGRGAIVITHGVSGSGKSHHSGRLPGLLPAVRVRSDVERKRLLGASAHDDVTAQGGYEARVTAQTYARLAELAGIVVAAGLIAVVDATFIDRAQRRRFRDLAGELDVPFVILDCKVPAGLLAERIRQRRLQSGNVSDADLAVLDRQLQQREALDDWERAHAVSVGVDDPHWIDTLRERVQR